MLVFCSEEHTLNQTLHYEKELTHFKPKTYPYRDDATGFMLYGM